MDPIRLEVKDNGIKFEEKVFNFTITSLLQDNEEYLQSNEHIVKFVVIIRFIMIWI